MPERVVPTPTSPSDMPATLAVIQQGIDDGLHLGAQLYASVGGKAVANFAVGESRPGVAMTPDTIVQWLSSGKPVAAVAIGQLLEQGALQLDDRVARYIPEFGVKGKGKITIQHLLTHTGGFRQTSVDDKVLPWDETIAGICAAPLESDWIPGKTAGYHRESSWFVLGEIVRRLDGRPYDVYVRGVIFEPLGMADSWIGMPERRYEEYGDRVARMYGTRTPPPSPTSIGDEAHATRCSPGGSGHGPIRELAAFYETLLADREGNAGRLVGSETAHLLTARHREGLVDRTWGLVMDWGLGFIVNSRRYGPATPYGYGDAASEDTFGHGGSQSSAAFADPERDLVVGYAFNGMPGEPKHQRRVRQITNAIYEDLDFAQHGRPRPKS